MFIFQNHVKWTPFITLFMQKVAQVNMIIKLYKHIVTVFVCKTG